jgi:phosphatidylglycerophosphatase A
MMMTQWDRFWVFAAQGFGAGWAPVAPGTWGSLVGMGWAGVLWSAGSPAVFTAGALAGIGFSIWSSGRAERVLGQRDPGSIVIDEIVAMPLCLAGYWLHRWRVLGQWPDGTDLRRSECWIAAVVLFALFRVLDIWKPWPIRSSQHLPGGWGVTADDVLAGAAVGLIGYGCARWVGPVL